MMNIRNSEPTIAFIRNSPDSFWSSSAPRKRKETVSGHCWVSSQACSSATLSLAVSGRVTPSAVVIVSVITTLAFTSIA